MLFLDTDAPVPPAPSAAVDPERPSPLVDVARVEVVDRATGLVACDACRRDIPLDEEKLAMHRVSFGIVATGHPLDVRVRMFLLERLGTKTEPPAGLTIERRSQVAAARAGVVSQWMFLPSDSWGELPTTADPPQVGEPPPSRVGTWSRAQPAPCTRAPRPDGPRFDGERCVPGGAFIRSNRGLEIYSAANSTPLTEPRIVALSPVLMDRYEYTIGRYMYDGQPSGAPPPWSYSASDAERPWRKYCTLGALRNDVAALPLNCVPWQTAAKLCEQVGGRLPTESELEFEATGRGEDRQFVWGEREPHRAPPVVPGGAPTACCSALIAARETATPEAIQYENAECSRLDSPPYGGAQPAGDEAVDFIERATQPGDCGHVKDISRDDIVGLQGSLMEWAMDVYANVDDECWSSPLLRVDPVCMASAQDGGPALRTTFGSHWADFFVNSSHQRTGRDPSVPLESGSEWLEWDVLGFRCVQPGVGP
jgi:formylglycine-generating enzyme required for sulfatase activity